MPGNWNDLQALPVIDDAFHGEVQRSLEHDDVAMRVRSRLPGARPNRGEFACGRHAIDGSHA
jgi:hypothetical protein